MGHKATVLQFITIFIASCSDGAYLVVEIHSEERVIPLISDIKPGCFTFFSGSMDIAVFNFEVDSRINLLSLSKSVVIKNGPVLIIIVC